MNTSTSVRERANGQSSRHVARNRAYSGTQSVMRALRLLKLFHGGTPELTFAEIRERSHLNRSTAFRILSALESEGMVERDPVTDAYRLGPQIAALGRRASGTGDLRGLAQRDMDALAAKTSETVTLEMLVEGQVRIIGESMGAHVLGAMPSVGTTWPAHATSSGKILLAELDADRCRSIIGPRLQPLTQRTITRRADLIGELQRVRKKGYAVNSEELEPGYVAIAVGVHDSRGEVVAALSVGGPKNRLARQRLDELALDLEETAKAISRQLGAA